MGYRTLVLLHNDRTSEWSNDPDLGQKIAVGMNSAMGLSNHELDYGSPAYLGYGRVVQCTHADTQTLAVVNGYSFSPVIHSFWRADEDVHGTQLRLLREAADRLGYNLTRKRTAK